MLGLTKSEKSTESLGSGIGFWFQAEKKSLPALLSAVSFCKSSLTIETVLVNCL